MITLHTETVIEAPQECCFDLARSVDLHAAGAAGIAGRATAGRTSGLSGMGDRTTWTAPLLRPALRADDGDHGV